MPKKVVFLFPGQGAQYVGMGKDFFENFPIAKHIFEQANDCLHLNLSSTIFESSEEELKKTINSQLGIFVCSMAILKVIETQMPNIEPVVCSGLSLGEYSALCAAKKITFEDSLKLVQKRAQYMEDACKKNKGTMAAVLGVDASVVEETISQCKSHKVWAANFNTKNQTVISGTIDGIAYASKLLREKGAKRIIPLEVGGAFHSGLMEEAQHKLAIEVEQTKILESDIDIVMNVPAKFVKNIEEIKKYLVLQITHSIRWQQSIDIIEKILPDIYIEIGPKKTLTAMNKKNNIKTLSVNIDNISDLDALKNLKF